MKKNLISILLAVAMLFGVASTVFAAGTTPRKITIYNEEDGHTYEAYQIFKGDLVSEYEKFDLTGFNFDATANTYTAGTTVYTVNGNELKDADGNVVAVSYTPQGGTADWYTKGNDAGGKKAKKTLTNPIWGANIDPAKVVDGKNFAQALAAEFATEFAANEVTLTAASTAADVLRALGFINDGPKLADVINEYLNGSPVAETNLQKGVEGSKYYELDDPDITDGYYFIKDKDHSLDTLPDDPRTESYTDFILKVVEEVSVVAKSDTPTIDKKILETRKVYDGSYIPVRAADVDPDAANPDAPMYFVTRYYPTQDDADNKRNEILDGTQINENTIVVIEYTTALTADATHDTNVPNTQAFYGDDNVPYALRVSENTASIGEYVQYEIVGTIPKMEGYKNYYYMMTDTLSKGLTPVIDGAGSNDATFQNTGANAATMPVTVQIYDADGDLKETITYNADKTSTGKNYYSEIIVRADGSHTMDIIFDNFIQYKEYAGGKVVVTYWAQVNNKAIIGNPGNPNEVDLTYSRNPNIEGTPDPENPNNPTKDPTAITGTTPKSIVRTYVTEIELIKQDADTKKPLTGAKFKVTGTRYIPAITTSEVYEEVATGATWYLLADGTYTDVAPTIDTYEYDGTGAVTRVITGTYPSYVGYDGTTVYGYETVAALSYTGAFADAAAAQAALEAEIKPGFKKTTKVDIEYRTENVDVEIEVDSEGRMLLGGLGAGDYTLEEIQAPAGYNLLDKKIKLEIRFNTNDNGTNEPAADYFTARWQFEGDTTWTDLTAQTKAINVAYDNAEQEIDDNYFQMKIDNKKGATLPETGGIGTTIFYILGVAMLIGAGLFLVIRRRTRGLVSE